MKHEAWSILCLLVLFILLVLIAILVRCFDNMDSLDTFMGGSQDAQVLHEDAIYDAHDNAHDDAHDDAHKDVLGGNSTLTGHHEYLQNQWATLGDEPSAHMVGEHPLDAGGYITGGAEMDAGPAAGKDINGLDATGEDATGEEATGGAANKVVSQKIGYDSTHWTVEPDAQTKQPDSSILLKSKKQIPKPAKKKWQLYKSWDDLKKDPGASADYFAARTATLNNPQFDWSSIYSMLRPLLDEPREYVGVIGVETDGRTLKLVASEASPDAVGEGVSETYFAGVPAELVGKYAERPALFFFHTHPADERASPLPSSPDLATAIYFGATARFAASVVVSRFGVLIYGLGWAGYKAINAATDWKLALLNYTHDVIAANESVRSWSWHNLRDYTDLYSRMRMFFYAHPSPQMVAASIHPPIMHCIESNIDHLIISEYSADISRHLAGKRKKQKHKTRASKDTPVIWSHYHEVPLALDR